VPRLWGLLVEGGDNTCINLFPTCGAEELFLAGAGRGTGTDFLGLQENLPVFALGVGPHG
jgi:hypothetical protein